MTNLFYIAAVAAIVAACKTGSGHGERSRDGGNEPVTFGGVNDGNTGELATTKNNPWFVGEAPAHYCVQFGPDSATAADSQKTIAQQIESAFAQWTDLLQTLRPETPGTTHEPVGEFLAGKGVATLTRSFQRVDCSADPEMRIKVGTWDPADTAFLKYTSRYTAAFALRTAYAEETGRSRGFIWLVADSGPRRYQGPAPDGAFWSQGKYLQNVLMHELGHVFGLDHVPHTFMDAGFPAGVLANKLAAAWSPDDFKALVGLDHERCGSFFHEDEQPVAIKEIFGVEPTVINSICWRAAEDRRRPEDSDTPMLFWLKGSGGETLAEQLFTNDGLFGETKKIGGNYLKKASAGEYRYAGITHLYYASFDLFRMHFERAGRQYWVEAEVMAPGLVQFRFAYDGPWKTLNALLLSLEQLKALEAAIKSAQFPEDGTSND